MVICWAESSQLEKNVTSGTRGIPGTIYHPSVALFFSVNEEDNCATFLLSALD